MAETALPNFGSGYATKIKDVTADLSRMGRGLANEGRDTAEKAKGTLEGPIGYLTKILGGDRSSITEATAPEAATILSQYDTARRAVASMPGRGGAKGEKIAESYFSEASDMTRLVEGIRPKAAQILSSIGLDLSKLGISEEELAQSGLVELLQSLVQQKGQTQQMWGDLGKGIGSIVGSLILG